MVSGEGSGGGSRDGPRGRDGSRGRGGRLALWVILGGVGGVAVAILLHRFAGVMGVAIGIAIAVGVAFGIVRRD